MGRRRLTEEEERLAIQDAEAARDDETVAPRRLELAPKKEGSVVLSVRLPASEAIALRELAAVRRQSLSDLLAEAVSALIESSGPSMSVSSRLSRLIVTGQVEPLRSITPASGPARFRTDAVPILTQ